MRRSRRAPWLQGALTATRRAFTAALNFRMVAGFLLWIAAEWPAPGEADQRAGHGDGAALACGTRRKPSTGQSFSGEWLIDADAVDLGPG